MIIETKIYKEGSKLRFEMLDDYDEKSIIFFDFNGYEFLSSTGKKISKNTAYSKIGDFEALDKGCLSISSKDQISLEYYNFLKEAQKYIDYSIHKRRDTIFNIVKVLSFLNRDDLKVLEQLYLLGIKIKNYNYSSPEDMVYLYKNKLKKDRIKFIKSLGDEVALSSKLLVILNNDNYYKMIKYTIEKGYIFNDLDSIMFLCKLTLFDDKFIELIDKFNYDSISLVDYLFNRCVVYEGFKNPFNKETNSYYPENKPLQCLYDYVNMSTKINAKAKFDKYPHYLLSKHQIVLKNFKLLEKKINEQMFKSQQEKMLKYQFSDKNYTVVVPLHPKELVKEGNELGHCVETYIERVTQGRTNIIFIRKKDTPEESLLTCEIKNSIVVQLEGNNRRAATKEEKDFVNVMIQKANLKKVS